MSEPSDATNAKYEAERAAADRREQAVRELVEAAEEIQYIAGPRLRAAIAAVRELDKI